MLIIIRTISCSSSKLICAHHQIVLKRDMPKKEVRQTLMFSATFPGPIQKLAAEFMKQYVWVGVGRVGSSVESITQVPPALTRPQMRGAVTGEHLLCP